MSAPGKQAPSRWGSFLSQAVAGMESRLDNMLADGDEVLQAQQQASPSTSTAHPSAAAKPESPKPEAVGSMATAMRSSPAASRSPSNSRASPNDRLQARLAKAMAGKNAAAAAGAGSPRGSADLQRASLDKDKDKDKELAGDKVATELSEAGGSGTTTPAAEETTADEKPVPQPGPEFPQNGTTDGTEASKEPPATSTPEPSTQDAQAESKQDVLKGDMSQLARDMAEIKVKQNEDIQEYVERIDSLQAKLQYLSKSAADAAKKAAREAPSGSADRKLAEKDEKIALLMEEGQKLSSTEAKFRTTVKKLRLQLADTEKQIDDLKVTKEKAVADADALRKRVDGSEQKEKRQEETRQATAALQREIESLKKDRTTRDEMIRRLEQESKQKAERAEAANAEALKKALAAEQDKQTALEESMASLRLEKESDATKHRQELTEWSEKHERTADRGRAMEEELKLELRAMESKLEAMRGAAEEASSGSGGEAQDKLLRQIETLQTQYMSARDNWQGLEASLLAKVAGMEKERDEAQRRESEMRKKARDAASRCRRLEEELQDVQPAYSTAQQELEACKEELAALKLSSKTTETALADMKAELEKRQRSTSRDDVADSARRQWMEDVAGATGSKNHSRPASPQVSMPRTFSSDLMGLQAPSRQRRGPSPGSIPDLADGLGISRRLPSYASGRPNHSSLAGSGPPPSPFSPFDPPSEQPSMPSPPPPEREDTVADTTPSSPRITAQDMVSVSTVAAGPSVQLVERMSAAIRRLEGEKVAAKEEMARVCNQRDEARSDMVDLMKELEGAKSATERVGKLEGEMEEMNARYQTTLEMLGEKSELVEELKADVQDVKAMYRELVESTVK